MADGKVLMLAYHFPPAASAGVFRTLRFVKYLPSCGWEPLVLSTSSAASGARHDPSLSSQLPDGVIVERTETWRPEELAATALKKWLGRSNHGSAATGNGRIESGRGSAPTCAQRRALLSTWMRNAWDLAFMTPDLGAWWFGPAVRAALRMVRRHKPDVTYSTGPPHSTHLVALAVKRLTDRPWLVDLRDPWARRPWGAKEQNPWGQRFARQFERICVEGADRVVLNTEPLCDEFRNYYRDERPEKFAVVSNGYDPEMQPAVERLVAEAAQQRDDAIVRLCHPGSLYRRRDPRPLVEAVASLVRTGTPVTLEQIGHCDERFGLPNLVRRLGLEDCVHLQPAVAHEEALKRMAAADVLVVVQPGTDLQVPGKLFEMLPFGKPILAVADAGATADLIERFHLGAVAAKNDCRTIAAAIRRIVERRDEFCAGRRREDALAAFDGRRLTEELAALLGRCVRAAQASRP